MFLDAAAPYDPKSRNCGTAVLAAFPELQPYVRHWPRNARNVWRAAKRAAARAELPAAGETGPAWGVAELGGEYVLCARAAHVWLARAHPRGLAVVPASCVIERWSPSPCLP